MGKPQSFRAWASVGDSSSTACPSSLCWMFLKTHNSKSVKYKKIQNSKYKRMSQSLIVIAKTLQAFCSGKSAWQFNVFELTVWKHSSVNISRATNFGLESLSLKIAGVKVKATRHQTTMTRKLPKEMTGWLRQSKGKLAKVKGKWQNNKWVGSTTFGIWCVWKVYHLCLFWVMETSAGYERRHYYVIYVHVFNVVLITLFWRSYAFLMYCTNKCMIFTG